MADLKLTELSAVTTPAFEDLAYLVDDPTGTPTSAKSALSAVFGLLAPNIAGGRLTLVTGQPVYAPANEPIPSSTDTSAETVSFSTAHGWVTGTTAIVQATGGGLTAGTQYYLNAASSTSVSFHTTLANALAGASKVNLTASITCPIAAMGIGNTTLYYTPYTGNRIGLYDGTSWACYTFSEVSLALSSLTSSKPYDVFLYNNAGTLTLELLVWTDDTTRATALTYQDGVLVKSGATTRRYLGTIYTTGTDSTELTSKKVYVWNNNNRVLHTLWVVDGAVSWTYTTLDTFRQANANTANQIDIVHGLVEDEISIALMQSSRTTTAGDTNGCAIGIDGTTVSALYARSALGRRQYDVSGRNSQYTAYWNGVSPTIGRHSFKWLEVFAGTAGTMTVFGYNTFGSGGFSRGESGMFGITRA